jgi:hypothetical protein
MDSPLPERRAVPAGVYETQVVFAMIRSPALPLDGMLCKGGVRHQFVIHFKNREYFIVFYEDIPDAIHADPVAAKAGKNMCPDWALY